MYTPLMAARVTKNRFVNTDTPMAMTPTTSPRLVPASALVASWADSMAGRRTEGTLPER